MSVSKFQILLESFPAECSLMWYTEICCQGHMLISSWVDATWPFHYCHLLKYAHNKGYQLKVREFHKTKICWEKTKVPLCIYIFQERGQGTSQCNDIWTFFFCWMCWSRHIDFFEQMCLVMHKWCGPSQRCTCYIKLWEG